MEGMITVRYAEDTQPKGRHFHDCFQLIYVVRGKARITVSGIEYEAGAGTLMLIGRFESHAIRIESETYHRYTVMLPPEIHTCHSVLGDRLLSLLVNRPAGFCHCADLSGCPQAEQLLRQMAAESEAPAPMGERMQILLLAQLLILFCRQQPEALQHDPANLKRIQQVRQYLEENYVSVCVLEELADRFHLSQSYLSHLFKDITGVSVISYLTAYRLAKAKHLLVETDMEIGKVSAACGFSDHSNFGRTFRSETGMTPTAFRKTYTVDLERKR